MTFKRPVLALSGLLLAAVTLYAAPQILLPGTPPGPAANPPRPFVEPLGPSFPDLRRQKAAPRRAPANPDLLKGAPDILPEPPLRTLRRDTLTRYLTQA